LAIYGGFQGNESSPTERNLDENRTLLSADSNADDSGTDNRSDNQVRIINIDQPSFPVRLDGLTLEGGHAFDSDAMGGGIRCHQANLSLSQVEFNRNHAVDGGALGSLNCILQLEDIRFVRNRAELGGSGGALYARGGSLLADRIYLLGNQAVSYGGGLFVPYLSNLTLTNLVAVGNGAHIGGGLALWSVPAGNLSHLSLVENNATSFADSLYAFGSEFTLSNSIVIEPTAHPSTMSSSTITLASSCVSSMTGVTTAVDVIAACSVNFERSPSSGADGGWGSDDDDYGSLLPRLSEPTEDTGDTSLSSGLELTSDISGSPRSCGPQVDMGAYESQNACSE